MTIKSEFLQQFSRFPFDLLLRPAPLSRSERDLVKHRVPNKLKLGVLKDKAGLLVKRTIGPFLQLPALQINAPFFDRFKPDQTF